MRKILMLFLLSVFTSLAQGQQFWAQDACWIYHDPQGMGLEAERLHHVSDTLVGGVLVQKTWRELGFLDQNGAFNSPGTPAAWSEYTKWQDDVLLLGAPPFIVWDTLYRLGLPGDRWWPIGSEAFCNGYDGMIQIVDTGHVVIQGVPLRTWALAYLDQAGDPLPGIFQTVTERLGSERRRFNPSLCSITVDFEWPPLLHYADGVINIPQGTTCDEIMSDGAVGSMRMTALVPNPGTDHLQLSGFGSSSAQVNVRDALGRLCFSTRNYRSGERIRAESWAPGSYFISVTDRSGNGSVLRWLKQ